MERMGAQKIWCGRGAKMVEGKAMIEISDDALKLLVAEHGVRGTARLLGMDETQTAAFRQRAYRHRWLEDPAVKELQRMSEKPAPANVARPVVAAVSPQAALLAEMKALNEKTRIGHARAAAKVAEHIQELPAHELLEKAQDVKATAQHADLVHGWKESGPASVKLRLDVVGSAQEPVIDVQADIVTPSDPYASEDLDDY